VVIPGYTGNVVKDGDKMKIAVVHDPFRSEEEQKMTEAIVRILSRNNDVSDVIFGDEFVRIIKTHDFVFNLSIWGGKEGRQVHVPAILDVLGIPYTGSPVLTHSICLDKIITKILLNSYGIPTPFYESFEVGKYPEIINRTMFVKPSREGSAVGIDKDSVVSDLPSYRDKVRRIHETFVEPALAEEFIDGKELTVGFIGNGDSLEVLPILEIDFSHLPKGVEQFFSFEVKHDYEEQTGFYCPAGISETLTNRIKSTAKKAFSILGLRDYARMDIRLRNEDFFFIDINSMPQLVPGYSDLPKMAAVAGYNYDDFIERILAAAIKRNTREE
jgi:D-alanine-D-alanine ligase